MENACTIVSTTNYEQAPTSQNEYFYDFWPLKSKPFFLENQWINHKILIKILVSNDFIKKFEDFEGIYQKRVLLKKQNEPTVFSLSVRTQQNCTQFKIIKNKTELICTDFADFDSSYKKDEKYMYKDFEIILILFSNDPWDHIRFKLKKAFFTHAVMRAYDGILTQKMSPQAKIEKKEGLLIQVSFVVPTSGNSANNRSNQSSKC
ncbi:hypothetical protein BpHYR1_034289 [Brachionus plicatilis]|uniref:Uncharacterized protein n=1 Tax=Brachionus plicatilis TaxID=10195 RepID=A0A3M7RV22_BRAPC|nr:hypothetical protein BpHYR1_034289 [Brachionus plicatilis]